MVIDGFRVVMTGKQLAVELVNLAKRYELQANEIEAELPLRTVDDVDRRTWRSNYNSHYLRRDRARARELRFFAEHLIGEATYHLTSEDVDYLELTDVQLRRGRP